MTSVPRKRAAAVAAGVIGLTVVLAVALPLLFGGTERRYRAAMAQDLENLVNTEEAYFRDYATYTTMLGSDYSTSAGVTVTIGAVTGTGWAATAQHNGTTRLCTIVLGSSAAPQAPDSGHVACP